MSAMTENSASGWTPERLAGFWAAMRALYGQRWVQEWGPQLHPAWERELRSLTPDEAALGWKACRDSGDNWPCTLPVFMKRVSESLAWQRRHDTVHQALPAPSSTMVTTLADMTADRLKAAEAVDLDRLKRALGHGDVVLAEHRRCVLRGGTHPAGAFGMRDREKARLECKRAGRSWHDFELWLMAHNGWTPEEEEGAQEALRRLGRVDLCTPPDKGTTPFLDAWRAAGE